MENLRCTWNIFSNLSPTLVRIFPLLYNVANKTRGDSMIENLKKKAFQLFLGISLKRRLFITYLLLSSLILMLTSVFFILPPKKY